MTKNYGVQEKFRGKTEKRGGRKLQEEYSPRREGTSMLHKKEGKPKKEVYFSGEDIADCSLTEARGPCGGEQAKIPTSWRETRLEVKGPPGRNERQRLRTGVSPQHGDQKKQKNCGHHIFFTLLH